MTRGKYVESTCHAFCNYRETNDTIDEDIMRSCSDSNILSLSLVLFHCKGENDDLRRSNFKRRRKWSKKYQRLAWTLN